MSEAALFEVQVLGHEVPHDAGLPKLVAEAQRFSARGFTPSYGPGDHGNMSCRTPRGLLITARETSKAQLRPEDFVEVVGCDERGLKPLVRCYGTRLPSTDTWLHWRVYATRPDASAILHGHDLVALRQARPLRLPMTSISAAQPSAALVEEVTQLMAEHAYVLLRDHGFVALGPSIEEAAALVDRHAHMARGL
jgi:ribulose-5-phosphate 4-epimerase/fuculose-1-phosphate aldolase